MSEKPDSIDADQINDETMNQNENFFRQMLEKKNEYIQQLKNNMANIQNIHQKKFDETVTEANNRIDELLKMIKNKHKIVDFLKIKLIDKSQISMKSKKK